MKKTQASRCWRGAQPRYRGLFEDPNIKRWYDNVSRGSRITADVYLRRLGSICKSRGIRSPEELLTRATGDGGTLWAYNLTMDLVTKLEAEGRAGSYIHSVTKALRSWFAHNGINLEGRVKIRGAQDTPSLRDKHAPMGSELAMFFSNAPPQTRCAGALVAQAGLRLEVVGNYDGSDGLRIGDLPEITIGPDAGDDGTGGQIGFSRTPAMVVVRPELSKAGHQYFTFLAKEGCEYITQYLTLRMRSGEKLNASSPLICPGSTKPRKNLFVRSSLVSALIRKRLRSCAIKARPYDLRSSFDTSLMLAESRGLIIRDYRVFFMGHKGDIEHRYTLNRHSLPSDVIGDMRASFEKAQRYLMTPQFSTEDDIATQVKRQMLLTVGYKQDELEKIALTEAGDEEIQDLVKQKLFAVMMNNGQRQRVVSPEEVEKAIAEGWEWIGNLPNGKAVLRLPV